MASNDQVTTDISGPLFSSGLLTQVLMSAIWMVAEIGEMEATKSLGAISGFNGFPGHAVLTWDMGHV